VTSFSLVVICVNLRLWIIALNPFSKSSILVFAFTAFVYLLTLLVLGHTYLGEVMQPEISGAFEMIFDGRALAVLLLTPLALGLDAAVFGLQRYLRPTPLEKVRQCRQKVSPVTEDPPKV